MANILSPLGFRALNVVWNSTADVVAVPDHPTLFTSSKAPAGLLLKRVSDISEALACGGVFFLSTTANKWVMYIGATAEAAIATTSLGKTPSKLASRTYDLTRDRRRDGEIVQYISPLTYPGPLPRIIGRQVTLFGGDLYERYELTDHFDQTDTVAVFGVVCGATEGFGHSPRSAGSVSFSYMASVVEMAVPFARYVTDIKPKMLQLVPFKVRSFYASTFDAALTSSGLAATKPTIAVTTMWRNLVECPPIRQSPVEFGHPVPGTAGTPIGEAGSQFQYNNIVGGVKMPNSGGDDKLRETTITTVPPDYGSALGNPFAGEYAGVSPSLRFMNRAGFKASALGSYTGYVMESPTSLTPEYLTLQQGVVSGLKVGVIRDGHVLGRSLVQNLRYADEDSLHESLADLLNETIDTKFTVAIDDGGVGAKYNYSREPTVDAVLEGGTLVSPNAIQAGSLPSSLDAFSTRWDQLAKVAAKAASDA